MAFRRRSGSSWVTPSNIRRRSGSSWVTINSVRRRSGSSWITVYTSYTPPSGSLAGLLAGYSDPTAVRPPNMRFINAYPTANASGGVGALSYAWAITSGAATISAGANARSCTIGANVMNYSSVSGNIRCIVSDSVSSTTLTGSYTLYYEAGQPV